MLFFSFPFPSAPFAIPFFRRFVFFAFFFSFLFFPLAQMAGVADLG